MYYYCIVADEFCFSEFSFMNLSAPLIEAVFLEYARFMINMGNKVAAKHYCQLAGENGQQLEKEVDILFP